MRSVEQLLPGVWASTTPVTFAQWQACFIDSGCPEPLPDRQGWSWQAPVVHVSYDDAQAYLGWLSRRTGWRYRLPYEDEWAKLALGGAAGPYPWGVTLGRGRTNCLDCGSHWDGRRASPVRNFAPNRLGMYDMVGNVAHWVQARESGVASAQSLCKANTHYAAIMGASWADPAKYLGVGEWACFPKVLRDDTIGFRVVAERPAGACSPSAHRHRCKP